MSYKTNIRSILDAHILRSGNIFKLSDESTLVNINSPINNDNEDRGKMRSFF